MFLMILKRRLKDYQKRNLSDHSDMQSGYRVLFLCIRKNGKLRVCIDFRDLNKATPMDGYLMPIADMLVDAATGHKVISFMDGNAGYNQIFMAKKDIAKTTFRCPGAISLFEWVVMTFGLKNAVATYQRPVNGKYLKKYYPSVWIDIG